jgi:hypothetical protein
VRTSERKATLHVDEEPLLAEQIGRPLPVTAGAHVITATAEGMFPGRVEVQVLAGRTSELWVAPTAPKRRLPGWAIGVITVSSLVVAAAIVTGAALGSRAADGQGAYVGTGGTVTVRP